MRTSSYGGGLLVLRALQIYADLVQMALSCYSLPRFLCSWMSPSQIGIASHSLSIQRGFSEAFAELCLLALNLRLSSWPRQVNVFFYLEQERAWRFLYTLLKLSKTSLPFNSDRAPKKIHPLTTYVETRLATFTPPVISPDRPVRLQSHSHGLRLQRCYATNCDSMLLHVSHDCR